MTMVIAMKGSPRKEGYSSILVDEVLRGAESKGAKTKIYELNDPDFRGCQGCYYCRTHPECCIDDIFKPFYQEIGDASAVVFGSAIYFADVTGQGKMGLDRLFPMVDGRSFSPRHPGKKVVTILSQGDAKPDRFAPAVKRLHGFFHAFGWHLEESLLSHGASTPGFTLSDDLKKRAFACGEKLVG